MFVLFLLVYLNFFGCITLSSSSTTVSPVFRALKTIIPREEEEKLNVWVAYFNLENEYGSPREVRLNNVVVWVAVLYLDILRHLVVYTTGCCEKGIPKSLAIL